MFTIAYIWLIGKFLNPIFKFVNDFQDHLGFNKMTTQISSNYQKPSSSSRMIIDYNSCQPFLLKFDTGVDVLKTSYFPHPICPIAMQFWPNFSDIFRTNDDPITSGSSTLSSLKFYSIVTIR